MNTNYCCSAFPLCTRTTSKLMNNRIFNRSLTDRVFLRLGVVDLLCFAGNSKRGSVKALLFKRSFSLFLSTILLEYPPKVVNQLRAIAIRFPSPLYYRNWMNEWLNGWWLVDFNCFVPGRCRFRLYAFTELYCISPEFIICTKCYRQWSLVVCSAIFRGDRGREGARENDDLFLVFAPVFKKDKFKVPSTRWFHSLLR